MLLVQSKRKQMVQHSLPLPSAMYSNDLKKKKNKLQGTIVDKHLPNATSSTIEQIPLLPSLVPSAVPQTIEQARKVYAIFNNNIVSQNIIEANESIAEKVAELNKLEELQQPYLPRKIP
jgi:transcriptional regulator of heat shock response